MKNLTKQMCGVGLALFGAILAGCGAAQTPGELVQARATYQQVATGKAANLNPVQVHEARKALDQAESAWSQEAELQDVRDLSYIAQRKAQRAQAVAEMTDSQNVLQQATLDFQAAQTKKAATATKALLGAEAQVKVEQLHTRLAEDNLVQERLARGAAETKASQAAAAAKLSEAELRDLETRKAVVPATLVSVSGTVLFPAGKLVLAPEARVRLDEVALALKDSTQKVIVEGHGDGKGRADVNLAMSLQRAQRVRTYLISKGIAADRIEAVGMGDARPVASSKSADGRASNRRVEIVLQPSQPAGPAEVAPPAAVKDKK